MALVPMEERLASKEKAWAGERRELTAKAEDGVRNLKAAEERCRELEKRKSEMEEARSVCACVSVCAIMLYNSSRKNDIRPLIPLSRNGIK